MNMRPIVGLFAALCFAGCSSSDARDVDPPAEEALQKGVLLTGDVAQDIHYEVQDGRALFEGDIVIGEVDSQGLRTDSYGISDGRTFGVGKLWPNHHVDFLIDNTLGSSEKALVLQAIDHWGMKTGLTFTDWTGKTSSPVAHIRFTKPSGKGCNSSKGRSGREQVVNLGPDCYHFDAIVHEIGHTVGLNHEHTRPDRDSYIVVNFSNIKANRKSQFDMLSEKASTLETTYDVDSVMHYNSMTTDVSFAIDPSKPILTRLDGTIFVAQDGSGLSPGDVAGVRRMYGLL